jgi:hypothetical protein
MLCAFSLRRSTLPLDDGNRLSLRSILARPSSPVAQLRPQHPRSGRHALLMHARFTPAHLLGLTLHTIFESAMPGWWPRPADRSSGCLSCSVASISEDMHFVAPQRPVPQLLQLPPCLSLTLT